MFKWMCLLVGLVLSAAIVFHGLTDRYYLVEKEETWGVFDKLTGDYTFMARDIQSSRTVKVNPLDGVIEVID